MPKRSFNAAEIVKNVVESSIRRRMGNDFVSQPKTTNMNPIPIICISDDDDDSTRLVDVEELMNKPLSRPKIKENPPNNRRATPSAGSAPQINPQPSTSGCSLPSQPQIRKAAKKQLPQATVASNASANVSLKNWQITASQPQMINPPYSIGNTSIIQVPRKQSSSHSKVASNRSANMSPNKGQVIPASSLQSPDPQPTTSGFTSPIQSKKRKAVPQQLSQTTVASNRSANMLPNKGLVTAASSMQALNPQPSTSGSTPPSQPQKRKEAKKQSPQATVASNGSPINGIVTAASSMQTLDPQPSTGGSTPRIQLKKRKAAPKISRDRSQSSDDSEPPMITKNPDIDKLLLKLQKALFKETNEADQHIPDPNSDEEIRNAFAVIAQRIKENARADDNIDVSNNQKRRRVQAATPLSEPSEDALTYAIKKSEEYIKFHFNQINRCYSTSCQNLTFQDRRLYLNLLGWKREWQRMDIKKIKGIVDVKASTDALLKVGFIQTLDRSCPLEDILQKMIDEEINALCRHFNIDSGGNKESGISRLVAAQNEDIKVKAIEMIGSKTIKLTEEASKFFHELIIAATCPFYTGRESERLPYLRRALDKLDQKEGSVLPFIHKPKELFRDLEHFEEYMESLKLSDELKEAKKEKTEENTEEKKKRNCSKVLTICEEAKEKLENMLSILNRSTHELFTTNTYHRKFTAGSVLSHCLSSSIDILRKVDQIFALKCIDLLLRQEYFAQRRRANWYEQKVLIMEKLSRYSSNIFEVLKEGLQDDKLSVLGHRIFSRKAYVYCKQKGKLSPPKIQELEGLLTLPPDNLTNFCYGLSSATKKMRSKKQLFEAMKKSICNPNYSNYRIDEGRAFINLALLLFYPVIYETMGEMFVSEMQDRPLDWGDEKFYQARKEEFERRCDAIISMSMEDIYSYIHTINLKNFIHHLMKKTGRSNVLFPKVDDEDVEFMMGLLKAMTVQKFTVAAKYLFENYNERKSGFPSVTLYNDEQCRFVEVLNSKSDPTVNQLLWLEKINSFGLNGFISQPKVKIKCKPQRPPLGEETQTN